MKPTILYVIIMMLAQQVYSQCNIQPHKRGEIISAEAEVIYEKAVYPTYYLAVLISLHIQKVDTVKEYGMGILTNQIGGSELIPRQVLMKFNDASHTQVILQAYQMMPTYIDGSGHTGNGCSFQLTQNQWDMITTYGISEVVAIDSRTNKGVKAHPYANILKEQANCLLTEIGGTN